MRPARRMPSGRLQTASGSLIRRWPRRRISWRMPGRAADGETEIEDARKEIVMAGRK